MPRQARIEDGVAVRFRGAVLERRREGVRGREEVRAVDKGFGALVVERRRRGGVEELRWEAGP